MYRKIYVVIFVFVVIVLVQGDDHGGEFGFPRKKSKSPKYLLVMILGALLIKSIIFPLAFKVMAAMTGMSVLISALGLIISSIVGFSKTVNAKTSDIKFRLENKSEDGLDYKLDNPLKISYDYNRF